MYLKEIKAYIPIDIKGIKIFPVSLSHSAPDNFGYAIYTKDDDDERTHFKKYVTEHWDSIKDYDDKIHIPYMREIPGYNMEAFRKKYKDVQILRRMLDVFRSDERKVAAIKKAGKKSVVE